MSTSSSTKLMTHMSENIVIYTCPTELLVFFV